MLKLKRLQLPLAMLIVTLLAGSVAAQSHAKPRRARANAICGNPQVRCNTSIPFQPHDLPFRIPNNAVIFDTEPFYVVILKTLTVTEDNCETFVAETERVQTQTMFPERKVFASRCMEPGNLFYTTISGSHRIMAVYAGATAAEANRVLQAVKATGNFPGAYLRRMRTGFNGT